ncbi:hypothetical protein [Brevibacillus laterosporus]|uniref:Uncharacterized protein n=1 Tax=Brevibacillus laterosporus TaxID=1465 RepID=A0AAP8QBE0_BRELA|nr:hypothetical protein [Brevibacillus laterosporus]MED1662999.1 hypothetical protein [Brevibacillus laterosporus]MED1668943.1 hypothetical protein [Brevibacillus laterosporus]MED1716524.1 hypothetical protein [Brevibacillus laterosporus]PPA86365.1 hypothetical protein C4A76_14060 [Brevibacillus laterosporus]PPA93999.1 hypothetical protein C4A77_15285 [Brevibacillus laterosporus]
MKMGWKVSSVLIGIFVVYLWIIHLPYPPLPIASMPVEQAMAMVKEHPEQLVSLGKEGGYEYYMMEGTQKEAAERLKQQMAQRGYQFIEQQGGGYFFERNGQKQVITSNMWTGKYVILKTANPLEKEREG